MGDIQRNERWGECCVIVKNGIRTFVEVGQALAEIKADKLYRASGYETWEDCCQREFGFSRQYAHSVMRASEVAAEFPELTTESQVREVAKAAPEKREAAVKAATKDDKPPTAKAIREAVEEQQSEPEVIDPIDAILAEASQFDALMNACSELTKRVRKLGEQACGVHLRVQEIEIELRNVRRAIKFARPHARCNYSRNCRGCRACKAMDESGKVITKGWVSFGVWNAAPEDLKNATA